MDVLHDRQHDTKITEREYLMYCYVCSFHLHHNLQYVYGVFTNLKMIYLLAQNFSVTMTSLGKGSPGF